MTFAWWPHTRSWRVASARLRCLRVVQELQRTGVAARLYRRGDRAPQVLVLSKRYDADSVQHAVELRERAGTKVALDLCDNHLQVDTPGPAFDRRRQALLDAIRRVDLVVCASDELARIVRSQAGAGVPITVIGDAVDAPAETPWHARWAHPLAELALRRYRQDLKNRGAPVGETRLVWFGNHGSPNVEGGMSDLERLKPLLEALSLGHPLSLTVISNHRGKFDQQFASWSIRRHYLEWEASTFTRALQANDIAVIPIGRNPFTMCKSSNRLATALIHGLAVAADSIPSYEPFRHCAVLDQWDAGLQRLIEDRQLRQQMRDAGREMVERTALIEHVARWWLEALSPLCVTSPAGAVVAAHRAAK